MIEDEEHVARIAEAIRNARGYADFYSWPDRDLAEWGVATAFAESATAEQGSPFTAITSRGRGADPPDCEALDVSNKRIAIEVTELVDRSAIKSAREARKLGNRLFSPAEWDSSKLRAMLAEALIKKDGVTLRDPPYDEYIVVIFTDEYFLPFQSAQSWLESHRFSEPRQISRAYLLLSYDPSHNGEPLIRLRW